MAAATEDADVSGCEQRERATQTQAIQQLFHAAGPDSGAVDTTFAGQVHRIRMHTIFSGVVNLRVKL